MQQCSGLNTITNYMYIHKNYQHVHKEKQGNLAGLPVCPISSLQLGNLTILQKQSLCLPMIDSFVSFLDNLWKVNFLREEQDNPFKQQTIKLQHSKETSCRIQKEVLLPQHHQKLEARRMPSSSMSSDRLYIHVDFHS